MPCKEGDTMAKSNGRNTSKAEQWQQWIQDWRASGLSVRGFCLRRGLAQPSFYAWRRKLERRAAEPATFIPLRILTDARAASAAALEIVLADGRSVRVQPGFDRATLRQVLAVLEEPPC
jgi:hypothetical protein